jgi:hypothetical protein
MPLTESDIQAAVTQLASSGRGSNALRILLEWLDDGGLGLDVDSQAAVFVLLEAAWGKYSMTVRDVMREALGR